MDKLTPKREKEIDYMLGHMKQTRAMAKAGLLKKPPKKKKKAKRLEIEAAAIERGRIIGQFQGHKKKPLEESLKEHVGHWIDKMDPLELVAMAGMTYTVHEVIVATPALMEAAANVAENPASSVWSNIVSSFGSAAIEVFLHMPMQATRALTTATAEPTKKAAAALENLLAKREFVIWIISFALAYIIVKHAGELAQALAGIGGNLTSIVTLLMPAVVAA